MKVLTVYFDSTKVFICQKKHIFFMRIKKLKHMNKNAFVTEP